MLPARRCIATVAMIGLSCATSAWSAEPPRIMFQNPTAPVVTSSAGNLNRYQETTATSFPTTSSAPLVWRAKKSTTEQVSATEPLSASNTSSAMNENSQATMVVDGQVRPVAFTLQLNGEKTPVQNKPRIRQVSEPMRSVLSARKPEEPAKGNDPFKDPFGDRMPTPAKIDLQTIQGQAPRGPAPRGDDGDSFVPPANPLQKPAPQAAPSNDEFIPQSPSPKAPTPAVPNASNIPQPESAFDELPPNPPSSLRGGEAYPPPFKGLPDVADDAPSKECKNIYNDRDACKEMDACNKSRARLLKDSIRRFTREQLDITVPYKPDADTPTEIEKAQQHLISELSKSGSREWRDRNNNLLATGQLVIVKNAAAVVRDADGNETSVSLRSLGDDEISFITAWYKVPPECLLANTPFTGRNFAATTFTWKASSLCHKPLYFEDVQLERYGHTAGPVLQPVASFAHFFGNIAILPYKMGINPPNECQYALGYYRPGSCAPWMIPPIPLSVRGGLAEAGAIIGGAALLP